MRQKLLALGISLVTAITLCLPVMAQVTSRENSINPGRIILLDITQVGQKSIAVGERGVIIESHDNGGTWQRVASPTTRALSKIVFIDNKTGIAVGHGGLLLRTTDGGESWVVIEVEEAGFESFLGASKLSNGMLIAYGAFGMYFESDDAGLTWTMREVVYEGFDWHISQVLEVDDSLILVGEAGTLAKSADYGETW